ncbi:MAG: 3-deoxy-manno-octulosonate-8-phosphatase KdsC [Methylococcaceae bacterium]|nr:3-deoxy-manno-octulosonate-8-phosphatase KdsC [Methylococcaceae bacterium]
MISHSLLLSPDVRQRAARIRLAIFDIDGVMTDGRLFFDDGGREYKSFHVRDGHGIKLLLQAGIEVAVISGRSSPNVAHRMTSLGIRHVYLGQDNKLEAFQTLCGNLGLSPEQVAHVGDDLIDLCLLSRVGLAVAVADAHPAIFPYVHWRTTIGGGLGAAREVCDLILAAQGKLDAVVAGHL